MIYIRKHELLRLISLVGGNGRFCEISFGEGVFSIDSFCEYRLIVKCPAKASGEQQACAAMVKVPALAAAVSMCSSVVSAEFSNDRVYISGGRCRITLKAIPITHDYCPDLGGDKYEVATSSDILPIMAKMQHSCNVLSSSRRERRALRVKISAGRALMMAANDHEVLIGGCSICSPSSMNVDASVPPQVVISLNGSSSNETLRIKSRSHVVEISTVSARIAAIYIAKTNKDYPAIEPLSATDIPLTGKITRYKILRGNSKYILVRKERDDV